MQFPADSQAPRPLYTLIKILGRSIMMFTVKVRVINRERLNDLEGPVILAANHCSHYDPIFLGVLTPLKIDWMSRVEFFCNPLMKRLMQGLDTFSVDRFGSAFSGIRTALRRLRDGRVVGIFPEGEVKAGEESILSGGRCRQGTFLLSRKTGVPVVPVVILGANMFEKVSPWLPARRGNLWIAVGEPIPANQGMLNNRKGREQMARAWESAIRQLAEELVAKYPDARDYWPKEIQRDGKASVIKR